MKMSKDLVLFRILKRYMAKIPDYKIYNIDNIPELKKVRDKLKKEGLSNPWLRNEAWRYDPKYFWTRRQRIVRFFTKGLPIGIVLTAITLGIEMFLDTGDEHGGHHGGHGEDACETHEEKEPEKKVEDPCD